MGKKVGGRTKKSDYFVLKKIYVLKITILVTAFPLYKILITIIVSIDSYKFIPLKNSKIKEAIYFNYAACGDLLA